MFYHFEELPSTIDEARDGKYGHGDVVVAEHQTAGRGQRGKKWSSEAGSNLMFSVVLDTSFLRADEQFLVLQVVALALVDTFALYGLDARIKWTNDIYIGDRKIVGVLIDHSVKDGMLSRSGAGIGINVNQRVFEEWLPNPTSMALEAGQEFDRREVLERFYEYLMGRFDELRENHPVSRSNGSQSRVGTDHPVSPVGCHPSAGGEFPTHRGTLQHDYHSKIYRLDTPARYALPDGTEFTGTIRGVGPGGELMVDNGRILRSYLFNEISFII